MDIGQAVDPHGSLQPRRRLAIVSTFDELCGIASYTKHLLPQLEHDFDIEVFDLDQFLFKNLSKRVQLLADQQIDDFVQRLSSFDCVNIQLEHGTLGTRPKDILRRFRKLAAAAPQLSVTFHTVLHNAPISWDDILANFFTGRWTKASNIYKSQKRSNLLAKPIYSFLNSLSRKKPVHVIAHSRRDMRVLKFVYGLKNAHAHPLSYLDTKRATEIRASTNRASFPSLSSLATDVKLIGTFGFLSPYKGFETVIKALHYLPADHHMLIFGGTHPQSIKKGVSIDPYLSELLTRGNIGRTTLDDVADLKSSKVSLSVDLGSNTNLTTEHPNDLSSRIHFMGVLSDDDFARAMSICDNVVVPYLEAGQSASGPISMALDMGCRVIASRTTTFLQLSRFHPDAIEFFDVGNFVELAQRISGPPAYEATQRILNYNTESNAAIYWTANGDGARTPQSARAGV